VTGRMAGKVVVITGAARGIGRGCAELLAHEGARLVIGDIRVDEGTQTAEAIRAEGGEVIFQQTDVVQEERCVALMDVAVDTYGRLDTLVNNVGWFPRGTLEETTTEFWEQVMAVNLRSAFYCCKHAVAHLRAAGGGSIVNIGSIHGLQGAPNVVAYSAAKGGLLALTRTLAGAYVGDRIRVNYIVPGWVLTEAEIELQRHRGFGEEDLRRIGDRLPLGRHQTPEDTAYAVVYLASDESSQVTGTVLHVDAGMSTLPLLPGVYID
jgi:NAD(P)-dependent dehydrogenase (short-subunit alcohol dehydrogenase family)